MLWKNYYVNRRALRSRRSMWNNFNRLQREMDYVFGGTSGPIRTGYPALNAWVSDESVVIKAELPGVNPEDIEISVVDEILTLSGTREAEDLPEGTRYYRRERKHGEFNRSIELPFRVDADAVEARFHSGVLDIVLPRVAEEKPRKITVTSA